MRVPSDFAVWMDGLSDEVSRQTGLPKSNTATMRRLALWGNGTIIPKGLGFDVVLIGKKKKK